MTLLPVNLVLFEPTEIDRPLPRADRRAIHVLEVLRRRPGESFDCGVANGPRGKATVVAVEADALTLTFAWGPPPGPADPITLIIGLPRPQTARDILRDATTLGVGSIHFVQTEKTERSYATSTLWSSGEWRRHVFAGAEQAFDTRVPAITHDLSLDAALAANRPGSRVALDNYEAEAALAALAFAAHSPVTVAIGPERGWSPRDRGQLRAHGFRLVHLGARVLRTEGAVVAALTLVRAKLGLLG